MSTDTRPRTSPSRRTRLVLPILASLLLLLTWGSVLPTAAAPPAAPAATNDLYAAVLPGKRAQVMAATAGRLSTYAITARLDATHHRLIAEERVAFVNETPSPLAEVYFRLYPNASYYGEGALSIDALRRGAQTIAKPELSVSDTVLRVPLPAKLRPGQTTEVTIGFTTVVPRDSAGSYGIFNDDTGDGTWILADWYPIVAGYEPDRGWRLDPPTSFGDPTFSDSALYDVTLAAPSSLTVVTSGRMVDEQKGAQTTRRHYVIGPARDFTLVADADYVSISKQVGETTLTSYANPKDAAGAQTALDAATTALRTYSAHLSPYLYDHLNLVEVPLAGALGVSWSGLVFLDGPRLYRDQGQNATQGDPDTFHFTVAHEIGHQWWGMLVGADSNDHAFMVEGLTNYTAVLSVEWTQGRQEEDYALRRYLGFYRVTLEQTGDDIADLPTQEGQDGSRRSAVVYGKAALGFLAIREQIGDDAFFAGLKRYATTFAFRNATPADLRAAFATASGQNLDELWRHWFEASEATPAEIDAVLDASP